MEDKKQGTEIKNDASASAFAKAINKADGFFKNSGGEDNGNFPGKEKYGKPNDLFAKFNSKHNKTNLSDTIPIAIEKKQEVKEDLVEPPTGGEPNVGENYQNPNTEVNKIKQDDGDRDVDNIIDDKPVKKPFIKSLKDANAKLEQEAQDLRRRLEEYEKNKLPEYENTINELRSKIDDGGTVKEINRLKKELDDAILTKSTIENELSNELKKLKEDNALLYLPADPTFKETYDKPISKGYSNITKIIGSNNDNTVDFNKAIQAYESSLNCPNEAEKNRQHNIAMDLLNGIYETLQPIQQAKFNQISYDILNNIENRNDALRNWKEVKIKIENERALGERNNSLRAQKAWRDAFNQEKERISKEVKYNDDISKIIQSEKYDDDTSIDEDIAYGSISADSRYTPNDVMRVMQQGVNYKKLKAYTFALEKQLQESNATINKLRGSSTANGNIGSSSSGNNTTPPHKEPSTTKKPSDLFRLFNEKYSR